MLIQIGVFQMASNGSRLLAFSVILLTTTALTTSMACASEPKKIGEVTALIAEASTADEAAEHSVDGKSGDTDFPFIGKMKALATVGEVDAKTGKALTGYPDGHAAWLADESTVRVVYQSESYATHSNETYPWVMKSGVKFTGSHIHTIDLDRVGLASFLDNRNAASSIVKGTGHLFNRIFNVFGKEVVPRALGGKWGNQTLPDGTIVEFHESRRLTKGDFFFHSFCGAHYEQAYKYGHGIGFADNVWLTAEEWNIEKRLFMKTVETDDTMGLASVVVDVANGIAYTVPALGQTGYEKLLPINPGHKDYVVLVLAGYNHDLEPAPLKIYVGKKGVDAVGKAVDQNGSASERDKFLARNGLLYGKIYGLAVKNENFAAIGIEKIDVKSKMMETYLRNANAPYTFDAAFFPTSYQWGGWDKPVAVGKTEMALWQRPEEQPSGHTFFVGDSKTEHPAVDPDITKHRYIQNMTDKGGILGFDLKGLKDVLTAAGGKLPVSIPTKVERILAAVDGSLTLETANKGIKHGGLGTAATSKRGTLKTEAPDGLQWIKAADADVLIVDEDSGNKFGERKFALVIDPATMKLKESGKGYFLAMAGGKNNPRAGNKVSAYGGTFSKATSSEFSGTWNVTALLARKIDGTFYSMKELAGTGEQAINASLPLTKFTFIGVVQHKGESGGTVAQVGADQGGQLFMFNLRLPAKALK